MRTILTIAGSDSSGGAGIQADIKTITAQKLYASSVITALTAQNTVGVQAIYDVPAEFVGQQLDAVFTDIPPQAVKIGMVSNSAIIQVIAEKLTEYKATNIVVDPVMVSTSQNRLIATDATATLIELLFPLASLITPNIAEAEVICQQAIKDEADMKECAQLMSAKYNTAVLLKGGHLASSALSESNTSPNSNTTHTSTEAIDWLCRESDLTRLSAPWINTPNTHGTGCTLSSAIACNLAMGDDLLTAVQSAKKYVTAALNTGLTLGQGNGPLNHMVNL